MSASFAPAVKASAAGADEESVGVRTVLYVDHTAKMGGGEIALLNLVCALDRRRYRPIVVLASDGPLVSKLRAGGIETRVEVLEASVLETRKESLGVGSLLRLRQASACVRCTLTIARLAKRLDVDLIHTNSLKADLYGGLAGRLAGIPVIWHVRDRIDRHYLPRPVAAAFRILAGVIPQMVVANSESTLRTLRSQRRQTAETVYRGVSLRRLGGSVDRSGSKDGDGPTETARPKETARRFQVVHDGFDARQFRESGPPSTANTSFGTAAKNQGPQSPTVVLVGRIAGWKGQHVFIQAAAMVRDRFPHARFQIIGSALFGEHEYDKSLRRMARELGMEHRVEFLGFREDVPALLAAADLVVHASTLGEPFGQVVIEGMAAGKPVIATDGGALPEIVVPGETGLLVPMGDAPAMAEAIAQLLGDPLRAAGMGAAGRARAHDCFTISHAARKFEGLYDSLLDACAQSRRPCPDGGDVGMTSSSHGTSIPEQSGFIS